MDKYVVDAMVRNRLDILNRITSLFIVKNLPVLTVTFTATENNMAVINLICLCPDARALSIISIGPAPGETESAPSAAKAAMATSNP